MNERIKKLAEQAGGGLSCIAEPLEHPWKFSESELAKFAELIVAECMNIVENHPIDPEDMPYNMRIIPYMIAVQEKMKLHFGVEL